MNNVNLTGRLTQDVVLRKTQSGKSVTNFTLAVNRNFNRSESDFISCQAWGKTAELICQYCNKGSQVGISGEIHTGSYEKNGQKIYTTTVVVSTLDFLESKQKSPYPNVDESFNRAAKPRYEYSLTQTAEMEDGLPF